MPFQKSAYRSLAEKLDAEKDEHRGRDAAAFSELVKLHSEKPRRLPASAIAYLMNVSPATARGWIKEWK